jgi:hypothetical protein
MHLCHRGEHDVEAEERVVAVGLREGEHALRPTVVDLDVGVVLVGGKRRLGLRGGGVLTGHDTAATSSPTPKEAAFVGFSLRGVVQ